jgi:hypothetical protein
VTKTCIAWLACLILQTSLARAQSATPTFNVLTRVLMVESQYERGTTFSLDVDQREYWITAKHILTGAEHPPYGSVTSKSASLRILDPSSPGEKWLAINFSVIETEKDVDIVALAPPQPLLDDPLPSVPGDSGGAFLGGDCEFLGFPYGGGWRATFTDGKSFWMPFVKHCTVSAMTHEDKRIWVLDGINNAGFSGGPVIFRTGPEQKIMAVVSGYHTEPTEVIPSAPDKSAPKSPKTKKPAAQPKETVNLNSGFIITFDISYAIDAIRQNPIGPLRKSK